MTCGERQAKFAELILGDLPAAEARALEEHAAACPACGRALADCRGLEQSLRQHLTDQEMPARMVFLSPASGAAGFFGWFGRAAAAGAVAAVVFFALVWGGLARLPMPAGGPAQPAALTRAQVEALVSQAVETRLAEQKQALEAQQASLRQDHARALAAVAQKLDYLESVQSAVWKETQQQGAVVELVARSALQPETKNR